MSDHSTNLQLPYLVAAQAQKHVVVNEALLRLDALVQLNVVSATTSAQPASPSDGALYILPAGKTGADWGGMTSQALAYYRDGAWEEITPPEGWRAFVCDTDQFLVYTGAAWSLLGADKLIAVSATDKVLGRVSSGAGVAEEITFTDQAQQLCDDASFRAMCATLGASYNLAKSGVKVNHTGNTTDTILATVTIPAGAIGANGALHVRCGFSATSSANNKVVRVRLGSTGAPPSGGLTLLSSTLTTAGIIAELVVFNRNAQNAQVGSRLTTGTPAFTTGAVDTSAAQTLVFTGELANSAETVSLEFLNVDLAYGA